MSEHDFVLVTEDALEVLCSDITFACLVHNLKEEVHLWLFALLGSLVDELAELFDFHLS